MPIVGHLRRGDAVHVRGRRFYLRPSGTATYLYESEAALRARRHAATIATYVLRRDGAREPAATNQVARRPRVTEEGIRYLYVVRNCDLARTDRALKIGITSSVPATLATYRRVLPNAQAILVADCGGAARLLEGELHRLFGAFRVDRSEVFEVRPHEVRRALTRYGFVRGSDGVFRRRH